MWNYMKLTLYWRTLPMEYHWVTQPEQWLILFDPLMPVTTQRGSKAMAETKEDFVTSLLAVVERFQLIFEPIFSGILDPHPRKLGRSLQSYEAQWKFSRINQPQKVRRSLPSKDNSRNLNRDGRPWATCQTGFLVFPKPQLTPHMLKYSVCVTSVWSSLRHSV